MTNPSTVWAQLALPITPVGNVPFVDIDGASIVTDSTNLFYVSNLNNLVNTAGYESGQLHITNGLHVSYGDSTITPGSAVINKIAGRAKFLTGTSSLVITNSLCNSTSIIHLQLEGAFDTTLTRLVVAAGAGIFVVTGNAAATANVQFSFTILNVS